MGSSTRTARKLFLVITAVAILAVLFIIGLSAARSAFQMRKYSSSAKVFVNSIPAGGLNAASQAPPFSELKDVELRANGSGNVADIVAFAPTAEEAEIKANTAVEKFIRAVQKVYGPGVQVSLIQKPEKGR